MHRMFIFGEKRRCVIEGRCCAVTAGRGKPPPGARHDPRGEVCRGPLSSHNSKGRSLQSAPQSLMGMCSAPNEARVIRYIVFIVCASRWAEMAGMVVVGGRDDAASMTASAIPELDVAQSTQCLTLAYESHTSCE